MSLSPKIIRRAELLGFTEPFIADLSSFSPDNARNIRGYVEKIFHGSMDWIDSTLERRSHPQSLWQEAKSAIMFGMNYGPDANPLENLDHSEIGSISVYARHKDYHNVMKGRLKEIAGLITRDTSADVKVFVDTAPLMEKPLAAQAGLGWQGKHTNLVSQKFGSWLFIGTILTEAHLEPTRSETDHCGSCRACLDICPTQAFPAPYKIDARRCISYLTIEHKGPVDIDLREKMGNRIYGCDDCLAVCPWNKFAQRTQEAKLAARDDLKSPKLEDLVELTDAHFRELFSGSPIKRIGRDQFIRNVLYAIGNSNRAELRPKALRHMKSENAVVRDAANWAAAKLQVSNE